MVERHDDFNTGSVEGTITDAVTGDGITETAYIVRKGWNNQTGDAVTEGVFEMQTILFQWKMEIIRLKSAKKAM